MPTAPGPRANPVCVGGIRAGGVIACDDGGWYESRGHCEGVRSTLKTLSYDCGNPVIICLRAFARSAFLFTGSPRSARDDKGDKVANSVLSRHPDTSNSAAVIPVRGVPTNTFVFVGCCLTPGSRSSNLFASANTELNKKYASLARQVYSPGFRGQAPE